MPVTIASVNNVPAESGNGSQTHIIYAINGSLWWAFWIDSTDTTTLRCASSPDLVTWTARTSATVTSQNGAEGRNLSVAYANISSTDVVHIAHAATNSTSQNLRGTMSGTTITWASDSNEGSTPGAAPDGTGSAIASDGTPFASNTGSGNLLAIKASNADTGTAWTAGWGSPTTVFSTAAFAGSTALVAVASAHVLYIGDNGSSNKTWNNLRYSLFTTSWATSAAVRGSNLGTSQDPADWGWAKLSNTDVHVMMRTGSGTFEHFRWNGTSFSAGDTVGSLTTAGGSGVAMSSDGTNVWAFAIASASGNDVYVNKWTSGTGWGGWVAQGLSSATRTKIGAYQVVSASTICVYWTEGSGTPFSFVSYKISLSSGLSRTASINVTPAMTAKRSGGFKRTGAINVTPSIRASVTQKRPAAINVHPLASVTRREGLGRTGAINVVQQYSASGVVTLRGRFVAVSVSPSFHVSRSGGFKRSGAISITPENLATRLVTRPRAAAISVRPAFTVRDRVFFGRFLSLSVQPSFLAKRSAGFKRSGGITIAPSILATATVRKSRNASVDVSPAFTVATRYQRARSASTNVPPVNLAVAVVTFGPTPAGALRSFLPVHIWDGDQLIFSGWVTQIVASSESPTFQVVDMTAQSIFFLAQTAFPAEVFEKVPLGVILQLYAAYNLPGATVGGVAPGPLSGYEAAETEALAVIVRDLLSDAISQNIPGSFNFDQNFGANLAFTGNFPPAPVELSDADPVTGNYPR